jgi:hypothetical protein
VWIAKTRQQPDGPPSDWGNLTFHVLQVLLDPEGLRAAYGESVKVPVSNGRYTIAKNTRGYHLPIPETVAHRIVDAWLSGGAEAAIQTAYDLLPPSQR